MGTAETQWIGMGHTGYPVITVCGSSKFRDEILEAVAALTVRGFLVISLGLFGHADLPDYNWDTDATDLKRMLDQMHRQKILMADAVYVVDPGGYTGESTRREINYAADNGKPVYYMSNGALLPGTPAEVIRAVCGTTGTSGTPETGSASSVSSAPGIAARDGVGQGE